MRSKLKKIGMLIIIYLILVALTFKLPANFFTDIIYNYDVDINNWDVMHVLLGYFPENLKQMMTYLELKDIKQVMIPLCFQLAGIFFAVNFLRIPLSYHQFVKSRITSKRQYYFFFFKTVLARAFGYGIVLVLALLTVTKMSPLVSQTSSYNYQQGNLFLYLLLYSVVLFLAILTLSILIFIGYLRNQSVPFIFLVIVFLLGINIFDRVTPNVNLILFDKCHLFLDSWLFWGSCLVIEGIFLWKLKLTQEEYND